MIIFHENGTFLKAPQIFVSTLSKRLAISSASACALFKRIYQKFDWRRMDITRDSATYTKLILQKQDKRVIKLTNPRY